jgi:hypothetical protein
LQQLQSVQEQAFGFTLNVQLKAMQYRQRYIAS